MCLCLVLLDLACILFGFSSIVNLIRIMITPPPPAPSQQEVYVASRRAFLQRQMDAALRDLQSSSECPVCLVPWHRMKHDDGVRFTMSPYSCCGHTTCAACYQRWLYTSEHTLHGKCLICR